MLIRKFFNLTQLLTGLALLACTAAAQVQSHDMALVDGKVYPSPTAPAIEHATVLIHDGVIVEVGTRVDVKVPAGTQTIDCSGKVITAGFWNSHVHFETGWANAADMPAPKLESLMQAMLTKWGFTTVWDLGSVPSNTLTIRKRVESGEVLGPRILMAGDIFPKNGHPVYLPPEMQLPEAATSDQAAQMAKNYLAMGMEGIKLFTGVYMGPKPVIEMPADIAAAAVEVAHAQGKPVFTHPQNRAGTDNALSAKVDVLAHTIPTENSFTADELTKMKAQHVALVPTLTLWTTVVQNPDVQKMLVASGVSEVKQHFAQGGTILFGTDVGFQSVYDTTSEYEFMGRAMGWRDVLASLTSNPSEFFHAAKQGKIEKGMAADLVVLNADPSDDVKNFANVGYTLRNGKIVYKQ